MENYIEKQVEDSSQTIRYWWLSVLLGVLAGVAGVAIFIYPAISYQWMSMAFGILIFLSGAIHIALSSSTRNRIVGRGWVMAGGIVEVVLGLILSFIPTISALTLPFFLGFWLMFRSFNLMGIGSDMSIQRVGGAGWTIFSGILLLICAVIILLEPLFFGIEAVIIWAGISLLVVAFSLIAFGIRMKTLHQELPHAA